MGVAPDISAALRKSRVFARAPKLTEAWEQVERWLELDSVWIPTPTDRHAEILGRLLAETSERADLVNDAHLAALAIEHGLTLCSADRDFSRFSGLRWENPLEQWTPSSADSGTFHHRNFSRRKRPFSSRRGFQRSPSFLTRAGTLSTRKSSIATPFSISFQVTGVETDARGLGRTE